MGEEAASQPAGANVKILKNGAVYDLDTKRIVANPGGGTTAISRANASDMHALRAEKYRRAAAAGLARIHPSNTPIGAWSYIVEQQGNLAADIDKGRSSTEAARFVGSAIGVLGAKNEADPGSNAPGGVVPGAILRGLLADLRLLRDQLGEDESG